MQLRAKGKGKRESLKGKGQKAKGKVPFLRNSWFLELFKGLF